MKMLGAKGTGNRYASRQPGKTNRSQRTTILGRLESELGLDMLASALGVQDESLKAIIQGRQPDADVRYFPHIYSRLEKAGIPSAILDGLVPISGQVLKKLKALAASSEDRTPLRRNNFKRLAKAFGERLEVLADALDMRQGSIVEVADGRLRLDDERFGHLNPRLMLAGFPNGWLNESEPQLPQNLIESLAKLAEAEPEDNYIAAPAEHVVQALAAHSPPPASALAPRTSDAAAVNQGPTSNSAAGVSLNSAKPETSFRSISRDIKGAAAPVKANTNHLENSVASKAKNSENDPAASQGHKGAKPTAPSGSAPNLSRGAREAGRPLTGRPGPGAKTTSKPLHAPAASALSSSLLGKSLIAPPAPLPAPSSANAQPDLSYSASEAIERPEPVAGARQVRKHPEGESELTRETSIARATALDSLLKTARRGAKVTLWRELLDRSLPYWGNIRRGGILLKDDVADEITALLQLPKGWLDNATFPPATIAPWVVDSRAPLPTTKEEAMGTVVEPAAAAPATQTEAPEPKRRGPKPRQPVAAAPAASLTTAQAAQQLAPTAPTAVPVPSAPAYPGFVWAPATNPHAIPAAGPLTHALRSTLERLAMEGKFTEQDAMRLLYYVMNQPGV